MATTHWVVENFRLSRKGNLVTGERTRWFHSAAEAEKFVRESLRDFESDGFAVNESPETGTYLVSDPDDPKDFRAYAIREAEGRCGPKTCEAAHEHWYATWKRQERQMRADNEASLLSLEFCPHSRPRMLGCSECESG